ncbi:MAG: hypothetical protein ABJN72_16810 [Sulfitobacter sp.]
MSDYDDELRWRLETLKVMFEDGKIKIAEHLADGVEESLSKVRYGLDGKIDLSTVDGRIRSMALMAAHAAQRDQAKDAISLSDITATYFEFVEKNLGFLTEPAASAGLDAHQFASTATRNEGFVKDFAPQIPAFLEALEDFWSNVADSAHYHIQDLHGTKAVFGGDLFPSYQKNIASSAGLYMDTIVLSDPFSQSRHIFKGAGVERQIYYLVKHTLNVLDYKDLATADFPNPIVAFAPFRSSIDASEGEFLKEVSTKDGLAHASHLFGKQFSDSDELWAYADKLKTPASVVAALADPERLLFDTDWTGNLEEQITRSLDGDWNELIGGDHHAGKLVVGQSFGRMGQATDILLKSRYLSGIPLIDAPTSWKYFNWKLEYNSAISQDDNANLHMVRGLQRAADTDEEWLGNIPPTALIEMRKEGAFDEIRSVLSSGVDSLAQANPDNFFRSSDQIVDNIRDAFDKHLAEVKDLRKKKIRFAGHDIGSMVAAGAIDIASIATGFGSFGAASLAVNQLVDTPKLREIPERFRNLKNAHIELKKSPMGLLFAHKSGR